jgi:hypothetical protein
MIVGGIESSCRCTAASISAGPSCLKAFCNIKWRYDHRPPRVLLHK